MNPVHHDEPFALSAGYSAPLCVGMFQAGALLAWAADWFGPENLRRSRVRWKEPVFPGDILTMRATILKEAEGLVELHLTCTRQTGGLAVEGWATFVAPTTELQAD
jgi:acyl dehydratase